MQKIRRRTILEKALRRDFVRALQITKALDKTLRPRLTEFLRAQRIGESRLRRSVG